jgi:hypothetical protein
MKRTHIAIVSALLALAMILGTFAATRTSGLGSSAQRSASAAYDARTRQLNAFEAKLRRQLAAATTPAAVAPKIVYHRPPPVVVVRHASHGDDGGFEHEGGDD